MTAKMSTVLIAIATTFALTVVKTVVGLLTGSISILSSALDSFTDLCAMSVSFAAVRTAEQPADRDHPFGHGKAEAIAGLLQALLIGASAIFLIVQAFHRIIDGYALRGETAGIAMMLVAIAASIFLARRMRQVCRETPSSALAAGALNFTSDIATGTGVLLALALERWARVPNADPIISIIISISIGAAAFRIGRDAVGQLMDRALPDETLVIIDSCIGSRAPTVKGYHELRTRWVGAEKHIEFHLEIDRGVSFERAHIVTEAIIDDLRRAIPGSRIIVHTDPA
jgi:ferrous-iron efflux pump FieF